LSSVPGGFRLPKRKKKGRDEEHVMCCHISSFVAQAPTSITSHTMTERSSHMYMMQINY
jgi:hypothetical protein